MRGTVIEILKGKIAHVPYEDVVKDVPPDMINKKVEDLPYSLWDLLEHIRIAQHDIVEFIKNEDYEETDWPSGFWPEKEGDEESWKESVEQFLEERKELIKIAKEKDLESDLQYQEGYSYLRELLLVAVHTSYHLGQMVLLRRLLAIWK